MPVDPIIMRGIGELRNIEGRITGIEAKFTKAMDMIRKKANEVEQEAKKSFNNIAEAADKSGKKIEKAFGKKFTSFFDGAAKSLISFNASIIGIGFKFLIEGIGRVIELKERWAKAIGQTNMKLGALTPNFNKMLSSVNKGRGIVRGLTDDFYAGAEIMEDYYSNLNDTSLASDKLTHHVIRLARGFNLGSQGVMQLDKSMRSIGMSTGDTDRMMVQMVEDSKLLGVNAQAIAKDLSEAGTMFARFGKEGSANLVRGAVFLKKFNISLKDTNSLMDTFDNFASGTESIAKFNTIFGTSLNSMDMLLDQDPAKRIERIRQSLLQQGVTFDTMLYSQKRALTEITGLQEEQLGTLLDVENAHISYSEFADKAQKKRVSEAEAQKKMQFQLQRTVQTMFAWGAAMDRITVAIGKALMPLLDALGLGKQGGYGKKMGSVTDHIVQFFEQLATNPEWIKTMQSLANLLKRMAKGLGELIRSGDLTKWIGKFVGFLPTLIKGSAALIAIWAGTKMLGALANIGKMASGLMSIGEAAIGGGGGGGGKEPKYLSEDAGDRDIGGIKRSRRRRNPKYRGLGSRAIGGVQRGAGMVAGYGMRMMAGIGIGAGVGAMTGGAGGGAIGGAIGGLLGPLGAAIGGAAGGYIQNAIEDKFEMKKYGATWSGFWDYLINGERQLTNAQAWDAKQKQYARAQEKFHQERMEKFQKEAEYLQLVENKNKTDQIKFDDQMKSIDKQIRERGRDKVKLTEQEIANMSPILNQLKGWSGANKNVLKTISDLEKGIVPTRSAIEAINKDYGRYQIALQKVIRETEKLVEVVGNEAKLKNAEALMIEENRKKDAEEKRRKLVGEGGQAVVNMAKGVGMTGEAWGGETVAGIRSMMGKGTEVGAEEAVKEAMRLEKEAKAKYGGTSDPWGRKLTDKEIKERQEKIKATEQIVAMTTEYQKNIKQTFVDSRSAERQIAILRNKGLAIAEAEVAFKMIGVKYQQKLADKQTAVEAAGGVFDIGKEILTLMETEMHMSKDAVKRYADAFSLPVPTETPMAAGGIVSRPMRALIGEAGPEAIIPLRTLAMGRGRQPMKFGGNAAKNLVNYAAGGGSSSGQQGTVFVAGDVYLDGKKVGRHIVRDAMENR